jgi:beta-aspartyl-peptidase (threonine type)
MRRARLTLLLAACGLGFVPGALRAASYQTWLTGNAADAKPAPTRAGLFLSGGGGDVAAAWKWFVASAGGGDIVVLRASGSDGYNDYVFSKIGGVDSIETILFHDASAAHDPRVLEIIARADGLFMAGGDQARYVNWWKGTPVGAALNAHLRAGKPLGGTSAGLAVLGQYYFPALHDSVTSATALRDPFHRAVTLGGGFIAAPALAGVITDSHFMARSRLGRLIVFLARLQAEEKPARLVGLGVDEGTALCVEPDGAATVFTEKNGLVWLVQATQLPRTFAAGQPLAMGGVRLVGLGPQSAFNLTTLRVDRPAALRTVTAADGKLVEEDFATK